MQETSVLFSLPMEIISDYCKLVLMPSSVIYTTHTYLAESCFS